MKQWIRRGAALGLALALTVTAASASQAMGWDVHTGRAPLSQGASLGKNVFWSDTYSDLRTEYYVEYSPNASVVPTVAYGSKVTDRVTLSGMAQTLESQGKRVVSGLNGDWYVLSTGAGHRLLQRHRGHRLQRRRHRFHRPQRAVCLRVLRRAGRKAGRRHQ